MMGAPTKEQTQVFDLTTLQAITPDWIDPMQPLLIPANPLHVKAHRLQVILAKLDQQAEKNPAQFNSANYMNILNEFIKCVTQIKEGKTSDDLLDEGSLDSDSSRSKAPAMGEGTSSSLDTGISADNPLAG